MSGGFQPVLKRSGGVADEPSFLASEHGMAKRAGVTVSGADVTPDGNGRKIVKAGTFVTPYTGGANVGKYGPWKNGGSNGLGAADPDVSGYTFESVDVTDGDVICGILIHGSVLKARTTTDVSSGIATAVAGRILFQ